MAAWLGAWLALGGIARAQEPVVAEVTVVPVVEPGKPMRFDPAPQNPGGSSLQGTQGSTEVPPAAEATCLLEDPTVDRMSTGVERCTRCHAGVGGFGRQGHPANVAYTTYGKDLRVAPASFNPAVVLPANKITCLTCHDPRSGLLHHLAAPTGGEVAKRLCVACHPR